MGMYSLTRLHNVKLNLKLHNTILDYVISSDIIANCQIQTWRL